jgi:hypothetical protein
MANEIENFKSERPDITGSSTINHRVRVKLQLNCSLYVYMQFIADSFNKNAFIDPMDVYKAIGMDVNQQNEMAKELIAKGFLYVNQQGVIFPTDKWATGWPKLEVEFEEFWKRGSKNCWTGSKKQAFALYCKVRKKTEKETLINQRDYYFDFLEATRKTGFNRAAMVVERWLDPKNEIYMEDFAQYIEELKTRYPGIFKPTTTGQPQAVSLTKEDYKKDYEQNSDK